MAQKDWRGNGNSIFKTLGASNHTDNDRETDDFYATDPVAIDLLLKYPHITLPHGIWEPSCGSGCMSQRLEARGYQVVSTDLVYRGYGRGGVNFFEQQRMPDGCNAIVTNPPYKFATEYVIHALDLLPAGGVLCLFLKTTFAEGKERYVRIFGITPPDTFCNAPSECFAPRTRSLSRWRQQVARQWHTHGGYGRRDIVAKPSSIGSTTPRPATLAS